MYSSNTLKREKYRKLSGIFIFVIVRKYSCMKNFILFFFLVNFSCTQAQNVAFIKKENLLKTVSFLSSPELDGRLPGSPGYHKAAEFMASEFKKLGLLPVGDSSYFQFTNVEYTEISDQFYFMLLHAGKPIATYKQGEDYIFRTNTGSGHARADVVFCGYGISEPALGYDDYADVDVKNKIVLVFKQNPGWKKNNKEWGEMLTRYKAQTASKHGALAILYVSVPNNWDGGVPIGSIMDGDGFYEQNIPQLHISYKVADDLLKETKSDLKILKSKIDSLQNPVSFSTETSVELSVNSKYIKNKRSENVIGFLEGKSKKDEYFVIGAHLDHVGRQGDLYFPGANDNASGSAAVLEVARAFVSGTKPERSIYFVLFTSEEQGLLGAKKFVENPPSSLEKCQAFINMDCIAYGDSIQVGCGKTSVNLWKLAKKSDSLSSKQMTERTWAGGGADAEPFYKKKIPTAYFVTTNSYKHLHLPSDKVETLNSDLFEKIVRLIFTTAWDIANGKYSREKIE